MNCQPQRLGTLLPLLLVLSSCGTLHQEYAGEPRPEYETAILANGHSPWSGGIAKLRALNGNPVRQSSTYDSFAILPGHYEIEATIHRWTWALGGAQAGGPFCIRFEAEAGKRYVLDGIADWFSYKPWQMWIEDEETGKIIAESGKVGTGGLNSDIPFEEAKMPCAE